MKGGWKESREKAKWQWCVMRMSAEGDCLSFHHRWRSVWRGRKHYSIFWTDDLLCVCLFM